MNAELSRIIDMHWKYVQQDTLGFHTYIKLQHYPNVALQLISWKEKELLFLGLNFGLESSTQEDSEILDKLRKSPFLSLVKPDEGYDLNNGDLYSVIAFYDIETAKRIMSSLFYDVFNQKDSDNLDYLIESDKVRYACSEGFKSKGVSCMSVLAIFILLLY